MKECIKDYWDWRSPSYHSEYSGIVDKERMMWRDVLGEALPDEREMKVLDIGTGPGTMALVLAGMGHNVTGVDISSGMLEMARRNAGESNLAVEFYQGDAENLPFKDGSFDLIINKYLLWTLPSPEGFLSECSRLLKEDGHFLAIDGMWFQPSAMQSLRSSLSGGLVALSGKKDEGTFERYYSGIRDDLPLYSTNTPERISSLLEQSGYSDISCRQIQEVPKFHFRHCSLPDKIRGIRTPYLISARH